MSGKQELVQNLLGINQHLVKQEYRERIKKIGSDPTGFENKMWSIVYALRPDRLTIGTDVRIQLPEKDYHPDIFATFASFALVVECTHTDHTSFHSEELARLEYFKKPLQNLVRREFQDKKLVAVFAVRNRAALTEPIRRRAEKEDIKILEERELDYFLSLFKDAGIGIFYQFWAKVSPSVLEISEHKVPAIRIREGRNSKYIFSIAPHELLKRAFISHRELTSPDERILSYQRMLKKSKLKRVAKYASRKHSFPSPIIVSFAGHANEQFDLPPRAPKGIDEIPDVRVGYLHLPTKPCSIYVVDGQHRLYGFSLLQPNNRYHINVIAYKGLHGKQEGEMFVDINLQQTKVPAQLLWELYPDILSEEDPDYFKAVISKAVENLVTTELRGQVTHISTGSKGPLTFQAMCTEIVRAGLITKQGGIIAGIVERNWERERSRLEDILSAFFDSIFQFGIPYPEVNTRFLLSNSGIIPLIRELGKICRHEQLHHPGRLRSAKSGLSQIFKEYLQPIYAFYASKPPEELDDRKRSRVGSSGFINTEDEMDDKIRDRIRTFPLREKRTPPELKIQCDLFVSDIQEINRDAISQSKRFIFETFDPDQVMKQLTKPAKDPAALERFVKIVHQELVESSGAQSPDNRVCKLLGIQSISDIKEIRRLSLLRNRSAHRDNLIEAAKRKEAVDFLRELAEVKSISNFDDLEAENCIKVQVNLLSTMRKDFLLRISSALKGA